MEMTPTNTTTVYRGVFVRSAPPPPPPKPGKSGESGGDAALASTGRPSGRTPRRSYSSPRIIRRGGGGGSTTNNVNALAETEDPDFDCCCCFGNESNCGGGLKKDQVLLRINVFIGLFFFLIHLGMIGYQIEANSALLLHNDDNLTLICMENYHPNVSQKFLVDYGMGIFRSFNYSNSSTLWIHQGPCHTVIPVGNFVYFLTMAIFSLILLFTTRLKNYQKIQLVGLAFWISIIASHLAYFLALIMDIIHGTLFRKIDTILNNSVWMGMLTAAHSIGGFALAYGIAFYCAYKWFIQIYDALPVNDDWYPKFKIVFDRYTKKIECFRPYHIMSGLIACAVGIYSFYKIVGHRVLLDVSNYSSQVSFVPYGLNWTLYTCVNNTNCDGPILQIHWIQYCWLSVSASMILGLVVQYKFLIYPWLMAMIISCISMTSKFIQLIMFSNEPIQGLVVVLLALFYGIAFILAVKTLNVTSSTSSQNNRNNQTPRIV